MRISQYVTIASLKQEYVTWQVYISWKRTTKNEKWWNLGYTTENMGQIEDMGKFIFVVKNVVIHKNTSLKMWNITFFRFFKCNYKIKK